MQGFFADLRYAWRRALRRPVVTLSIIALLALGMGGVTAVFNPIYSMNFAPLPFPQPEQLVRIGGNIPLFNLQDGSFDREEILGLIFSNMTAYYIPQKYRLQIPGNDKQIEASSLVVSENFFETLGVKPMMGYGCADKENEFSIVVSHRFWRNELNQKTDVIGSHLLSRNESLVPIIGIMPEGFVFPYDTDIWQCRHWSTFERLHFVGRLRPGITYRQAANVLQSNFEPVKGYVIMIHPSAGPLLQPLQTFLYGDRQPMLRILSAAAILFLALVCAGVVNLLIMQGTRRKQEIATRLIYGATRWNLIFQLLAETLPLVVIGGLAGWWISEVAGAWMLAQLPALRGGSVDVTVKMAFLAALTLAVTLIGGLIPALYATSLDLNTYLKAASGGSRRFISSQELLVGVQLSMALALLIGMGILIRSMIFNVDIPIGWSSRDIAVVRVSHNLAPFAGTVIDPQQFRGINQDILNELRALPEVMNIGFLNPIPFSEITIINRGRSILSETKPSMYDDVEQIFSRTSAVQATANSDGFNILGIPLVAGRHFTEAEIASRTTMSSAVIVNQALARQMWPEENNVLGKSFFAGTTAHYEVVGVVRNYHYTPGNKDFIPTMYLPYNAEGTGIIAMIKLRPGASFQNFHANVRQRLAGFSPDWIEVKPMSEYVKDATATQRLTLKLLICFTVLGIVIAGLAVYATASLAAAARTRETGIRMAMGAQTWDIFKLALWRGVRAIVFGLPFGLFLAWILTKLLEKYLVQVNIDDSLMWLISCVILLVITVVAALIPALRATRINPLDALRDE